jgi:hypothetical protein
VTSEPDLSGPKSVSKRESARSGSPLDDPSFLAGLRPIPSTTPGTTGPWPASDIRGIDPGGAPVEVLLDQHTGRLLLAFLSINCDGCEEFWDRFRSPERLDLSSDLSPVIVTKGPDLVRASEVASIASGILRVPVVMSDQAWADYRVMGYPFFVVVDVGARSVVGETVGMGWPDVAAII